MHYRLYRSGDFPQLYAIELACFQPSIRFSRCTMQQLIANPDSATWIAEEGQHQIDQQMTGFAIVDWSEQATQTIAYIQTVEVAPDHRRSGIAAELLRRMEASALAAGAQTIGLHVAENNTSALYLYQAHGYLPRGREENYYTRGLHALVYAKPLA